MTALVWRREGNPFMEQARLLRV